MYKAARRVGEAREVRKVEPKWGEEVVSDPGASSSRAAQEQSLTSPLKMTRSELDSSRKRSGAGGGRRSARPRDVYEARRNSPSSLSDQNVKPEIQKACCWYDNLPSLTYCFHLRPICLSDASSSSEALGKTE